jgi:hypothetical protein
MVNNTQEKLKGEMVLEICGHTFSRTVTLLPGQPNKFEIPVKEVLEKLTPGTLPFCVKFRNVTKTFHAFDWTLPPGEISGKKIIPLDIQKYYNINLSQLYGTDYLKWRTDYTGAAVGVDWRDTLYADRLGYKLFVPPTSVISYGILPEQHSPAWWSVPSIPDTLLYPIPFSYIEHRPDKNNVIALVNAENNRDIPSECVIKFNKPVQAGKVFLLTANLTKPCKSYYPAAEVEVFYEHGDSRTFQLIPPFTMPSLVQSFCPGAFEVPLGKIENNQVFHGLVKPGLSVTDFVTDPAKRIAGMTFRCVASETVLGIIGISLLKLQ